jgi:hypothetical protein
MLHRYKDDVRNVLPLLPAAHYRTIYADPPWAEIGGGRYAVALKDITV